MLKLKSEIINLRRSVKHNDNNKHNYVWYTWKCGDIVPEEFVQSVKNLGGEFYEEEKKKESVKEPVKQEVKKVKKVEEVIEEVVGEVKDIKDMSKNELEKYAMDNFGIDLDKRKNINLLRFMVRKLIRDRGG